MWNKPDLGTEKKGTRFERRKRMNANQLMDYGVNETLYSRDAVLLIPIKLTLSLWALACTVIGEKGVG